MRVDERRASSYRLQRSRARRARSRSRDFAACRIFFRDGVQKMAKKLVEEAIEVGLDAVQMNRDAVILEQSADVLYHLALVVWAECGITPGDVFSEIDRRERLYGFAEKLPKQAMAAHARRLSSLAMRRKVSP